MAVKCGRCGFDNSEGTQLCIKCGNRLKSESGFQTKTIASDTGHLHPQSLFAGRYKILQELGRGGMGIIYKAEDTRLNRIIALKLLSPNLTGKEDAKKRFIREAQSAAALDHPNICNIHEIDQAEGKTFISMAFVEGKSLREIISSGPLKHEKASRIALQIAEGLKAAHKKGIVHRDIKPANIMLTESGQAKIMDFGIAKSEACEDITQPAAVLGTAAYMSPEQVKCQKVDNRTDIWAFGAVLHEMLTGKPPFKGTHEQAALYAIVNEKPELERKAPGEISPRAQEIILKCLKKDPSERYQNAEELIHELKLLSAAGSEAKRHAPGNGARFEKSTKTKWIFPAAAAAVSLIAVLAAGYFFFTNKKTGLPEKPRVAVLPFENLGPADDEYFAEGMTEEITSRLAKISSLGVISRTSAALYAGSQKSIRQIGKELDVDYVLEGTVQWFNTPEGLERVKITPQLIQTSDDTHVWADSFDQVVEDIFNIQNSIAQIVVEKLGITLLEGEKNAVSTPPTENVEAYQAFLRGRYLAGRPHYTEENWEHVIRSFQQAVNLDPDFGQAYAELAKAHARYYFLRSDLSDERLAMAESAARKALELSPDSPEVHLALSYYYLWAHRDKELALKELKTAEKSLPENPEILKAQGEIFEVLGKYEEGIDILKKAQKLSPNDSGIHSYLAAFYWMTRQYRLGIEHSDKAIQLAPDEAWPYLYKIFNIWSSRGATQESRAVVKAMPQDHDWTLWVWFWQEAGENNFHAALKRLSADPSRKWIKLKTWGRPVSMFEAFAFEFLNDKEKAHEAYEEARSILENEAAEHPDDPRFHSSLGIAYAALGFKNEAIREGEKAAALLPLSEDPLYGACFVQDLALIYLYTGEYEACLDQIEILLNNYTWISPSFLKIYPQFNVLQNFPRYQKLTKQYYRENPLD